MKIYIFFGIHLLYIPSEKFFAFEPTHNKSTGLYLWYSFRPYPNFIFICAWCWGLTRPIWILKIREKIVSQSVKCGEIWICCWNRFNLLRLTSFQPISGLFSFSPKNYSKRDENHAVFWLRYLKQCMHVHSSIRWRESVVYIFSISSLSL